MFSKLRLKFFSIKSTKTNKNTFLFSVLLCFGVEAGLDEKSILGKNLDRKYQPIRASDLIGFWTTMCILLAVTL
jgi:hypothetical protein